VGKKDLYDFLSHEGEHEYKETYEYLKYSIKLLQEKKIVHYDLKENNIMIHENSSLPIIIDFGISLNIEKLLAGGAGTSTLEELKHAFYAYSPTYEVWCFEINFICFLFNARGSRGDDAAFVNTPISSPITNEDLKAVVIDYQKNPVFDITNIDREKYSAELIAFYGKYLGKPANEAIIDIITKYWRTWDVYSLAICFLNAINGAEFENKSVFQKELLKSVLVNPELRV
jgi:serine/threonine protein kinase